MSQSQNNDSSSTRSHSTTSPPDPHAHEAAHELSSASTRAEMAQAFKDLARGEQQAAAIEANLASLESKLDALLASIEAGDDGVKVDGAEEDTKSQKEKPHEDK
ncbi:hypothetical protein GGR51DRAFT_525925 [Nemania sp. FL0031]|nr:hypothetical protein GGR51DRAFT_525925 [Nemania sp. FL0031]